MTRESPSLRRAKEIYEKWGRGDYSATSWTAEDIVLEIADGPDRGEWHGATEMKDAWRGWLGQWTDFQTEPLEFRELEEGRVMVRTRFTGSGRSSGLDISALATTGVSVFEFDGELVKRLVLYTDPRRAFADLGLGSQDEERSGSS